MTTFSALPAFQASRAWHDGGMFMGMHWLWWAFWIATLAVLMWSFFRLLADRSETRQGVRREAAAELLLRERFARGEIDEDQYVRRLEVLRETHLGV